MQITHSLLSNSHRHGPPNDARSPRPTQQLDLFSSAQQPPHAIPGPYGKLFPGDRKVKQYELPLGADRVEAPDFPTAGNEIHSSVTAKLNFNGLNRPGSELLDSVKVLDRARQGNRLKAGAITVEPHRLDEVRNYLGPNAVLRVQTLVGKDVESPEVRLAEIRNAVLGGADELAVVLDYSRLFSGDKVGFREELEDLREAAGEVPLKLVFDGRRQTDKEIADIAKVAEEAGITYLRTASGLPEYSGPLFGETHRSPLQLANLLKGVTKLNIEFASGITSLDQTRAISAVLDDRRLRFESLSAEEIADTESQRLRDLQKGESQSLGQEMRGSAGLNSLEEREKLMRHFENKVSEARQAGKPLVYLSVPVRSNDAGDFESNLTRATELVAKAEEAGVAYIDPFEVEGTPILTSKDISGRAVQELLMDPSNGLWPRVLGMCDAIAHAPNWKFSTGAREEQLMADVWGIPVWDGTAQAVVKDDKPLEPTFFLVE